MNFSYWTAFYFCKILFHLFYKLRVVGTENLPEGPAIIAPNHTSFFDPPIIGASLNEEVHFLAMADLFKSTFFRWLITKLNAHPVTNGADNLHSMRLALTLLKERKKIVIFPEGKRSFDGHLNENKSGVSLLSLKARTPIIPVYIDGAFDAWPSTKRFPRPFGKIKVFFGNPINPKNFQSLPPKEARDAMTNAFSNSLDHLEEIAKTTR